MHSINLFPLEYWVEMMRAIRESREEDVKSLLAKCDPSCNNNQALYVAVHMGKPIIVGTLLSKTTTTDWGNLLFDACSQNHFSVVKVLLQKGMYKDSEIQSALCIGVYNHSVESIEFLCPHLSENGVGWGLIWAGDTWPALDAIYLPLLACLKVDPFSVMDWSGQPFSPQRQEKIKQSVEQAYAHFIKGKIEPHISSALMTPSTTRNRRI